MNYKSEFEKAISAEAYYNLVNELVEEGGSTGPLQNDAMANYTKLNHQRMSRILKTLKPDDSLVSALSSKKNDLAFLIITESWCGDAAQSVPVVTELAKAAGIESKIALRDENLDLIDAHLTKGGRSIPIIIALSKKDWKPIFTWGPRPAELQQMVMDYKHEPEPKREYAEFQKEAQLWYAKDKQKSTQSELLELLK